MYYFYKLLPSGRKYVGKFNSTLDPGYHEYINWCKANNMGWELERVSDGVIVANDKVGFCNIGVDKLSY